MPLPSFHQSTYPFTHVGMDVHKDSISVGILPPDFEVPEVERIFPDDVSIRRLIARLGEPTQLRACYEAGPTGYGLARLLRSIGVHCDVVAPSLIPKRSGDRVKTDKRDCRRLARLHRMGELVAIRVPTPAEEGVRDLSRTRRALVADRRRARQRLNSMLLRHGQIYRAGKAWTIRHHEWLASRHFDDRATQQAFNLLAAVVSIHDADVTAVEQQLEPWFEDQLFFEPARRLVCYRGIQRVGALCLLSEVCDWHRFASAHTHMAFCGLVPCENSSGGHENRGELTKTGNVHVRTQLIESAWAYQYQPNVSRDIAKRQAGANPDTIARAWAAQLRLSRRFRTLAVRKPRTVAITAVARELAGFVWAEMTA